MTALSEDGVDALFPYKEGRAITLSTLDGAEIQASILRVLSITMSPVMQVQVLSQKGTSTAILKLFDRRIGESRKRQPYNKAREALWQESVRSGLATRMLEELQEEHDERVRRRHQEFNDGTTAKYWDLKSGNSEESSNEEEEKQEEETMIFYDAREQYRKEVRAYEHLTALQGKCVPKFLGSVIYNPPDMPADLAAEFFQVPGILVEYIESFPLSKLTSFIPNNPDLWRKIVEEATLVVRKVNLAGVVHYDCQPRNVLVSSKVGEAAHRAWMIDFAQSDVADDFKDTDNIYDYNGFINQVHSTDNHGAIPALMNIRIKRETGLDLGLTTWSGCGLTETSCSCFERP